MNNGTISIALHTFLADQLHGGQARRFFRLDGFDEAVYRGLLERIHAEGDTLSGHPLWVRTTDPIPGYETYALEPGKSATWYRNHVPPGHVLLLIFNRHTSDAQSLKDIYPVTESLLADEGLDHLIAAAFAQYQPSKEQVGVLKNFLERLHRHLLRPQLHDLVAFLSALDAHLHAHPGATMEAAIAENLPHLGLFRCRELAEHLNTPKGDRLLKDVHRAARLGLELLDENQRSQYERRLAEAEFDDDSPYGGPSVDEKHALLERFLNEVLTERDDLLRVFQIDWREVAPVLHKSRRKTAAEKMQELAVALQTALADQHLDESALPETAQDVLQDLTEGQPPEDEGLDALLTDYGDALPKKLRNQLRCLRGVKRRQTTDFIAGLASLAVELLLPLQDELPAGTLLRVRFDDRTLERITAKEAEALLAFRTLYGGIEERMPHVQWDLAALWKLAQQHADLVDQAEEEEEGEREKEVKVDLRFRVTVVSLPSPSGREAGGEGNDQEELDRAELTWQYRSEGPSGATFAHLRAEAERLTEQDTDGPLFASTARRLPIPIYNTCPPADQIGDLDLSRPVASLGAWYRECTDLSEEFRDALAQRARPETRANLEAALTRLETAWADFVAEADGNGLLSTALDDFLTAYDGFLQTALANLQQGQEVLHGYRLLSQAWMVGMETFDEWAMMPALHPLKLYWQRARTHAFDALIARLLDAEHPAAIVDERRFRQELEVTYGSAGYPAVLALPGRDRRPDYFLPVHEMDGYELFRRAGQATVAFGLDPTLVSEAEGEEAAKIAARELARVVQDYVETYPFVRDGLEVYLLQCRNGALPGLLVERLAQLARRRRWDLHLHVIVHSTDRGAPLYRRVVEWLNAHEEFIERPANAYFPPVSLRVLECGYEELFGQLGDTDLVILPDVLAEQGQAIEADVETEPVALHNTADLPRYRAQQAPFERGEVSRVTELIPAPQPALFRHFYLTQWAAVEQKPITPNSHVAFRQRVSLQAWERELAELHRRFNWVACYDTIVDRFLLEDTFTETVQVIRYSLGLGIKRRHNLTVSSSRRVQDIVESRLTVNLETLLPGTPEEFRRQVARRLVEEAKQVSGDIVLRAAGPGTFLNELIGLVVAKHQTEHRYLKEHPGALTAWIYLDDFAHWFNGKLPDLLFVAIPPEANGELPLHIEVIETKCVGEVNFAVEAADAQRQVAQGVNRLAPAWMPGAAHLDAPFWYDQLYRAVVGNLAVEQSRMRLWQAFRRRLPAGDFTLEMSGHAWVFCYDGSGGILGATDEREADIVAPDVPTIPHHRHFAGRAGLRQYLRSLVDEWKLETPAETWSPAYDEALHPPVPPVVEAEAPVEVRPEPAPPASTSPAEPEPAQKEDALSAWVREKAQQLARVLRDYGLRVYPIEPDKADIGPSVVRFKVRLRPGEKLSHLQAIAADLQRELALTAVPLVANVLGTQYVGIDLPRPEPETLSLIEALAELPSAGVGYLPFLVGKRASGETVNADLAALPHLLVAGSTGSGKTIFLYTLIISLLHQFGPGALSLLLVDPKQTDFVYFEGLPHLLDGQVVIEAEEAIDRLVQLTTETLDTRTRQLRQARCRDILDYNTRHPNGPIPPTVVVIDEYADLVQVLDRSSRQEFERQLGRLAQRGRNVGIHLVIATQRPSGDLVTTSLKANLPARIAFRLPSYHDSMTILDQPGAENLLGRGDMLFSNKGQVERLQGFYISPDELAAVLSKLP